MTSPTDADSLRWRALTAGPLVAILTLLAALVATHQTGVPLRDPGFVAGRRFAAALGLVAVLVAFDVVLRAGRRSGRRLPSRAAMASVRRERWSAGRVGIIAGALVSFHVTYLAYRNLKSIVPLLRPGELFDRRLGELDRSLFAGNDPAALLQTALGTGVAAQVLSAAYLLLFVFIPVSLALALVLLPDLRGGLFYATALGINWALGAASYFLLPSLGPIYADPSAFAALPATSVSDLQSLLLAQRLEFLRDPVAGSAQSIGAFASLHCSILFTSAVAAHLLGLARWLKLGVWTLFALTAAATVYFGWHYVLDDLGGMVIAIAALTLAGRLTGFELRAARRPRVPAPVPA